MTDPMETDHINQLYPLRQWFDDVYFEEGRKANTGGTSSIGGHGRTLFVAIEASYVLDMITGAWNAEHVC